MRPIDGRLADMSHDEYLAHPAFSASRAKVVHASSPAHALVYTEPTPAMDAGSAFHALLLGSGPQIHLVDARDWRTAAAKAAKDDAHAAGKIPLLPPAFERISNAARTAADRMRDEGIMFDGSSEKTLLWAEQHEFGPDGVADLACKCRIDHLRIGPAKAQIFEVKTSASAAPRDVERTAESLGYGIAAAAYLRAMWAAYPDLLGRVEFFFIFVEIEPPYAISIFEPDEAFISVGSDRWQRAARTWAHCVSHNDWPAYRGLQPLSCPPWVLSRLAAGEDV